MESKGLEGAYSFSSYEWRLRLRQLHISPGDTVKSTGIVLRMKAGPKFTYGMHNNVG